MGVLALTLAATGCPALSTTNPQPVPVDVQKIEAKATIPVGTGPHGMTFAGGAIVNDNPGSGDVSFIDPVANKAVAIVTVGKGHHKMAFTSDGTKGFVSNFTANTVSVVDRTAIK